MKQRGSGVLLHLTSLPSRCGIGDLGPGAYRFADFLEQARQSHWQLLPLNPTSTAQGNSPYSCDSAFAGNPLLISLDPLLDEGLLVKADLQETPAFPAHRVDYPAVETFKGRLLRLAYERAGPSLDRSPEFRRFAQKQAHWLDDYALFKALKEQRAGAAWTEWPEEHRDRDGAALQKARDQFADRIRREQFLQFLFSKQWQALKRYCNDRRVQIIGDVPIYVQHDSADVWAHREGFKLDPRGRPAALAGVPPDYFSATGQLWGNPVYRWDALKATHYRWWIQRVAHNLAWFDLIRLDHFRGFAAFWEVPAGEQTAVNGRWVEGPGEDFFKTLFRRFHSLPVIAEDLGVITPDVRELMRKYDLPGMKLLIFAFGDDLPTHPYAPHNFTRNCVVYTGTHDNNTIRGWWQKEMQPEELRRLCAYLGRDVTEASIHWEMIRLAFMSVADLAVIPMQDLLGLGEEARMNRPSIANGNWEWRLAPRQLTPALTAKLLQITQLYGRG
ncbi:MAG: 4-alpha-glucanotransferase [Nitrospirota bacterium]